MKELIKYTWTYAFILSCIMNLHGQVVVIENYGSFDRRYERHLIVTDENVNTYKLGGGNYNSITKAEFDTIRYLIEKLHIPKMTMNGSAGYFITIMNDTVTNEYMLEDQEILCSYFKSLSGILSSKELSDELMRLCTYEEEEN